MEKNDLMTFGLAGNEFLVNLYCDLLKENPNTRLLAIYSPDLLKEKIESKGLRYCQNYDDLIHQHHEIDSIIIASPYHFHHSHALSALWAGKNVLCKKPIATNLQDVESLVETAIRMEKTLMTPFNHDYCEEVQKKLEAKNKQNKKITSFSAIACGNISGNDFVNDQDREDKYAGTGCLINLAADILILLYEFLGPLKVISSKLECLQYGPEISANIKFSFNTGEGILYSSSRFEKEKKEINFLTAGGETIKIDLINKNLSQEEIRLYHKNALNHFINAVEKKERHGEKALEVQKIIHEIYQMQS